MNAARLVRAARAHAGLTQRALAERAGLSQPTLAAIESGRQDPRYGTLERLMRAAGQQLDLAPRAGEGVDRTQFHTVLRLSPSRRLVLVGQGAQMLRVLGSAKRVGGRPRKVAPKRGGMARLDALALLRVLARREVRFVVIGGVAGTLHGSTTLTLDLDILYDRDRENIRRLALALAELGAVRRGLPPDLVTPVDAQALLNGLNFLFTTRYGDLDCIGETASGRFTYAQLAATAERHDIGGVEISVVSLDELIRMKSATGRLKDRVEVENLSALRDEREGRA